MYTVDLIHVVCSKVHVEVVTIQGHSIQICVRAEQSMLVRLLIWRCVYVFVLALNEDPELV